MADNDDINKSKSSAVNQIVDDGFSAIERIGRRSAHRSAEDRSERQRIATAAERKKELEGLIAENPVVGASSIVTGALKQDRETINRLGNRIRVRRDSRVDRAEQETQNAIEREFSKRSINGQVSDLMSNDDSQLAGMGMMGMSSRQIGEKRAAVSADIGGLEKKASQIASRLYDQEGRPNPKAQAELKEVYGQRAERVQELSAIAAAEQKKRAIGQDTQSQTNELFKQGQKAEALLGVRQAEQDRANGTGLGALNVGELKRQEAQHAQELVKVLKELSDGTAKTKEAMEELQDKAAGAAENLGKTQEALAAAGGGNNKNAISMLGQVGGILSPIGQAFMQIGVQQTMQLKQNQTGFAQQANQAFESRNAAIGGNMTELTLLNSDTFKRAEAEGQSLKKYGQIAQGINATTGVANAAAGGLQTVNAAKNVGFTAGFTGGGELMQGVGQTVAGASQAAIAGADLYRDVTGSSLNLSGQQMDLSLDRERVKVTGAMRQNLYNYSMGMRGAANAAGGSAGVNIRQQFANEGTLQKLEDSRIGTDQFADLASTGAAAQGSRFDTQQIFAARNLERSGNGDMATNIGRMSTLAAAGGNNPQANLSSVMEAAFSKSLDSSKALNMMVENTAAMVSQSQGAQMGMLDTTKSASGILAGLVNQDNPNKESAINRAATAAQTLDSINSGIGNNFADMVGTASIANKAGVSDISAMALKNMDNTTAGAMLQESKRIKSLNGEDRIKAENKFALDLSESAGLGELTEIGPNGNRTVKFDKLEAGIKERSKSVLRQNTVTAGVDQNLPGYEKLMSGDMDMEELRKPENKKLLDQYGASLRLSPNGKLSVQESLSGGMPGDTSAGAGKAAGAMAGATGPVGQAMDDLATAKFKEVSKQARLAADELGGVTKALESIRKATEGLGGKLNDNTADEFRGAAAEAAKDFKSAAGTFSNGVTEFGRIVEKLAANQTTTQPKLPENLMKHVDGLKKR